MELLKISGQGAQAIQRGVIGSPLSRQPALEGWLGFGRESCLFGMLECRNLAGVSEFTFRISATSSHVTRLTRVPSVLKGSEGVTE